MNAKIAEYKPCTTTKEPRKHFYGKTTPFFQPKLTVNTPGDAYEQEADQVADQVMRMQEGDAPIVQRMPLTSVGDVQRKCAACEQEEQQAQRKESGGGDASGKAAPGIVSDVLSSGSGRSMEGGIRQFMESRFGQDFSQVRVHTDSRAAESATAIQAKAYTSGRDIVFGQGQYQPESDSGKRLLAHELAHVGQQGGEKNRVDRACVNGQWEHEYDGCSAPDSLTNLLGINKDNPAGGSDTHFGSTTRQHMGRPCDYHDDCYQTCSSSKDVCDFNMYRRMLQVCRSSSEPASVKASCVRWANLYYLALRAGGDVAFWQRKWEVCRC